MNIIHDTIIVALCPSKLQIDTLSMHIHNAQNDTVNIVSIISAITALIAVFVGPIIQMHINKKQIKNQNMITEKTFEFQDKLKDNEIKKRFLSEKRTEWIGKLREIFSELNSKIFMYAYYVKEKNIGIHEMVKIMEQIDYLSTNVELSLNPNPEDKNAEKIKIVLTDIKRMVHEKGIEFKEIKKAQNEFVEIAAKILKEEWEKAKELK